MDPDKLGRLRDTIEVLEHLAEDMRRLADIDEDLRIRLVTAAGQLTRPDRYTRKALGKALTRQKFRAKRDADRAILDQTGIRALRREPVFRTPLPKPQDMALDAPVRDAAEAGEDVDAWAAAEAERAGGPSSDSA